MALHTKVEAVDDRYLANRSRRNHGPDADHIAECGRVLVVDGTQDAGGAITQELRVAGFWVYHAHNCGEAFEVLKDCKIALLVLDAHWSLGGALLDILEVASKLPKVIGLTAGWWESALDPRISAVVAKPIELNALMRLVVRLARLSPKTAKVRVPSLGLVGSSVV